jgi:hypothetical protein
MVETLLKPGDDEYPALLGAIPNLPALTSGAHGR